MYELQLAEEALPHPSRKLGSEAHCNLSENDLRPSGLEMHTSPHELVSWTRGTDTYCDLLGDSVFLLESSRE